MENIPYKEGDVVVLKSGGPEMTVEKIDADYSGETEVICSWFIGENRKRETFHPEALEISND